MPFISLIVPHSDPSLSIISTRRHEDERSAAVDLMTMLAAELVNDPDIMAKTSPVILPTPDAVFSEWMDGTHDESALAREAIIDVAAITILLGCSLPDAL